MAFSGAVRADAHGSTFNEVLGNQTNNTYITSSGMSFPKRINPTYLLPSPGPSASTNVGSSASARASYNEQGASDSEIYARILLAKKHGYPLWLPEPFSNLPREYRKKGVSVGDLGIITSDGAFDFLFNICLPSHHPINSGRVPSGFLPLELDRHRDIATAPEMHSPGCDIASTSIKMENIESDVEFSGRRYAYFTFLDLS
jgi:hypothetical protein